MRGLGHERFALVGHDRGGRCSYRLALDHPGTLARLAVLDITPTFDYWRRLDRRFGLSIYHWMFLAQPYPLPETLIGAAPDFFLEHKMSTWGRDGHVRLFDPVAFESYRSNVRDPERLHAMCEDYRAGASVDVDHDIVDREARKRIAVPLLVLWGTGGAAPTGDTPVETWREWADDVRGVPIDSGHYLPEENPRQVLDALIPFLKG
jgi:haloacetate dehalogenase